MGKRSFKGDKRRRQLEKKKKQDQKRAKRLSKDDGQESTAEDTSYLEYLNPGGPMDERYAEEDDAEESDADENDDEE